MKRPFLLFLPFLLFVAGAFVACEEVQEEGKYDNWQQRNEAFIDSIKVETGKNYITKLEDVDKVAVGELFAIPVISGGTSGGSQYVYCKKLEKNEVGQRPVYSGAGATFVSHYYGTYITGNQFDGTFVGYSAIDQNIPIPPTKKPTDFNSPATLVVNEMIAGWIWPLQYMREGERWMLYIPWQSGYGASDFTVNLPDGSRKTILGHSTLTFDLILDDIVD